MPWPRRIFKTRINKTLLLILLAYSFFLSTAYYAGPDSYYFLNQICNKNQTIDAPPLSALIFKILPCNIFLLKIFSFLIYAAYIGIVHKSAKQFNLNPQHATLTLFLSPLIPYFFFQLEDDQLGLLPLTLALYYFIRGQKEKNEQHKLLSLTLILFSALLWKTSILYLFALGLSYTPATIGSIISILVFPQIIQSLLPNWTVKENLPLYGLAYIFMLLMGAIHNEKSHARQKWFFIILATLNAKFAINAIYLLALDAPHFLKKLIPVAKNAYIHLAIALLLIGSILGALTTPNQEYFSDLNHATKYAQKYKLPVNNEFGIGHYLEYAHLPYSDKAGYSGRQTYKSLVIHQQELPQDCPLLWKGKYISLSDCRNAPQKEFWDLNLYFPVA